MVLRVPVFCHVFQWPKCF